MGVGRGRFPGMAVCIHGSLSKFMRTIFVDLVGGARFIVFPFSFCFLSSSLSFLSLFLFLFPGESRCARTCDNIKPILMNSLEAGIGAQFALYVFVSQ